MTSTEPVIPRRYEQLVEIAIERQVKNFVEIGAWKGKRAVFINRAVPGLMYYGFDVWEEGNEELDKREFNGKPRVTAKSVADSLDEHGVKYELWRGLTTHTLPNFTVTHQKTADLVFIDGGHSVETIEHDFIYARQIVKDDGVVVFDDFYVNGRAEVLEEIGCNNVVANINYEIMPKIDTVSGVKIAFVKWEPKNG